MPSPPPILSGVHGRAVDRRHGCDLRDEVGHRVDGAGSVRRFPGVASRARHRDAAPDRADADGRDPSQVVALHRDERSDGLRRRVERGRDAAQVPEALLADRREQPDRHPRSVEQAGRGRERGDPHGVVADARSAQPGAVRTRPVRLARAEHRVDVRAEDHGGPVAPPRVGPHVPGFVHEHVAQPIGVPPRPNQRRAVRLEPRRGRQLRELDRSPQHDVRHRSAPHGAIATPSDTSSSTASALSPTSVRTSRVCAPSAGAGEGYGNGARSNRTGTPTTR